jgi:hypothetical protein
VLIALVVGIGPRKSGGSSASTFRSTAMGAAFNRRRRVDHEERVPGARIADPDFGTMLATRESPAAGYGPPGSRAGRAQAGVGLQGRGATYGAND